MASTDRIIVNSELKWMRKEVFVVKFKELSRKFRV
jgi:hypothetical protein